MNARWFLFGACALLYGFLAWSNRVELKRGKASVVSTVEMLRTRQSETSRTSIPDVTLQDAAIGKEPMVEMLTDAGVQLNVSLIEQLPTWEQVVDLYGDKPIIYGVEQACQRFQNEVPSSLAKIAPAGLFNTGTNTMANYLYKNCVNPDYEHNTTHAMQWQVPWGKHLLASKRDVQRVSDVNVLPVVMVRDPYFWMISQCRNPYRVRWPHKAKHCPNLVPNEFDIVNFPSLSTKTTVPVSISFGKKGSSFQMVSDSLVGVWNEWNREYFDLEDRPRIIVRFEDLLFRPKQLVEAICVCGGGKLKNETRFHYHADSIKAGARPESVGHHSSTTMLTAMIKYGKDQNRRTGFTHDDLNFAAQALDAEMMETLGYSIVE